MLDLVGHVLGYLGAGLVGGTLKTLYDRHNNVADRRADRQQVVVDAVLKTMTVVHDEYRGYRARREQGATETPEGRIALDKARGALQAEIVRLHLESLRDAATKWLTATEMYAAQDPDMPVWKEEELWEAALEALGSAVRG